MKNFYKNIYNYTLVFMSQHQI